MTIGDVTFGDTDTVGGFPEMAIEVHQRLIFLALTVIIYITHHPSNI
jgi:hypothetical protein